MNFLWVSFKNYQKKLNYQLSSIKRITRLMLKKEVKLSIILKMINKNLFLMLTVLMNWISFNKELGKKEAKFRINLKLHILLTNPFEDHEEKAQFQPQSPKNGSKVYLKSTLNLKNNPKKYHQHNL